MNSDGKLSSILSKLEIVVAALLFLAMIISCGLYIDIKINGKTSSLPEMSDADKKLLLRTVASESVAYNDDLIEPVFVGIKNELSKVAACPDDAARHAVENSVYDSLYLLFSGTNEKVSFESVEDRTAYIQKLKDSDSYMLLGFYSDLPSSVILPCLSKNYDIGGMQNLFFVKYLFLMPDNDGNIYGVSVSENGSINKLYPSEKAPFNKLLAETYDVSNGYSYFEYDESSDLRPVLTSSFMSSKYRVSNLSSVYGKDRNSEWVDKLFDVFSINSSLVKEYPSNNNTEINYVDDVREVAVSDSGNVEFKVTGKAGIYLDEYLGYLPDANSGYTFNDKIFAVKSIVNKLMGDEKYHSYSIVGVDYDKDNGDFVVYLKSMVEGILVTENNYDAVFEIKNDSLTYASFYAVSCEELDDYSVILPQKYANLFKDEKHETQNNDEEASESGTAQEMSEITDAAYDEIICPVLSPEEPDSDIHVLKWAKISCQTEVAE